MMTRTSLTLILTLSMLPGCAVMDRMRGVPDSNPTPGVGMATELAPPVQTSALPGTAAATSAEALDQTTEAERAAATAIPAKGAGKELGRVVVGLGPVTEQGFWLKSELVSAPATGRVVTASGATVAVDLVPGAGGALLSLAAFRALQLSLTDLPQVTVFSD